MSCLKKYLSVFLALIMCFSMLPLEVIAADLENEPQSGEISELVADGETLSGEPSEEHTNSPAEVPPEQLETPSEQPTEPSAADVPTEEEPTEPASEEIPTENVSRQRRKFYL